VAGEPRLDIDSSSSFEIIDTPLQDAVIKVIGVGDCGGNAVDYMIEHGLRGVKFVAINTDAGALIRNKAPTHLKIGTGITQGIGEGATPVVQSAATREDHARITELIMGSHMVFIVAGMGGGTGTGAAPVVAQIAKDMGILTVAVVTKPFTLENNRLGLAKIGIEKLREHVDSLFLVQNDKLMDIPGDDTEIALLKAYRHSHCVMLDAVSCIAESINAPGLVAVDFADVRTLMSASGIAMVGAASASGSSRAKTATECAISSKLMEDVMTYASSVLVKISSDYSLTLKEYREVYNCIQLANPDATTMVTSVFDESMGDEMRVSIVATGLG